MSDVTLEIDGHVATVLLDRPEKRNAVDLAMFEALADCGRQLKQNRQVRAVVLAGAGGTFCAGLDLAMFSAAGSEELAPLLAPRPPSPANLFQAAAWTWRELPVPVVCALEGVAFGAGLQIALGADMRVAAPGARLSVMEVHWGLVPDMALTLTARGLVRLDILCELAMSGRIVDAAEGRELGLVTLLDEAPLAAAQRLALAIARHSPDAVRGIKTLLRDAWQAPPADALALEARVQAGLIGTPNQREAVAAKLGDRPARFD